MGAGSTFKRHTLWLAFLAVLVPLGVLLVFQSRWLSQLEEASSLAHRATLNNYLAAVVTDIEYFYLSNAERALQLPAELFTERYVRKAARFFAARKVEGAEILFVLDLTDEHGELWFYDPAQVTMVPAPELPETDSILAACAPWRVLSEEGTPVTAVGLTVDEHDPSTRIMLCPVTDENKRLIALSGYVVSLEELKTKVFPAAVGKALDRFFEDDKRDFVVTLREPNGELFCSTAEAEVGPDEESLGFGFILRDFQLGLRGRHATPEQWARANFKLNMTLSALLAVLLMGGIAYALRTASREQRLSRMKSEFISNVSHELRTPLASVRVFAELLRHGRAESPEKVREYGEYIETESRRLTRLINNILDFAGIESGQKTYSFSEGDLAELVQETVRTFEARLRNTTFAISVEIQDDPLPPVRLDPDAMTQAIHNLLDNAVKYAGDSTAIDVRLGRRDGLVWVAVQDHGLGIPRSEQARIFERFHRVGTGLVHDIKGSGLGLAIVKHIVKAHEGLVLVDSGPGEGSTFTIYLPEAVSGAPSLEVS